MNPYHQTHSCRILIFSAFCFLLSAPLLSHAADEDYSRDQKFVLRQGLRKRSYLVHVPPSYRPGRPTPLVISFHGGGGNAEGQMASSGMNETSDQEGFLAVYPQGTAEILRNKFKTWNAGRCCGYARDHRIDDVGFVNTMIDQLEKVFSIDPKRIYATGLSNGASMSYRLACESSKRIAAIAPVGSVGVFDECRPNRSVPIIHFHGTADPTSFYKGGMCGGAYEQWFAKLGFGDGIPKSSSLWACQAVPDYIAGWSRQNGCSEIPKVTYEKGAAKCVQYDGCRENASVALCSMSGAGHTWPGGSYGLVCKNRNSRACKTFSETVGPISRDISANDMMWQFFKKHSL